MPTKNKSAQHTAATSVLSATLSDIPHEQHQSGCITIHPDATYSQMMQAMRRGYEHATVTITQINFYKGDLWNLIASKYRGGMDFMRASFGEDAAEVMAIHFKNRGRIAKYTPEAIRDLEKPWSYYVNMVNAEGKTRRSRFESICDFTVTMSQTAAVFDYTEGGRFRHYELPIGPIKEAVIRRYTDPYTGVLDFGE